MGLPGRILRELLGLFVDDGLFAASIVVWLLAFWLTAGMGSVGQTWSGPALFAGLAVILVVSAWRRARR